MKQLLLAGALLLSIQLIKAQENPDWKNYTAIIKKTIYNDYKGMYKEAGESLTFPFITPGSSQYSDQLWDWDSWLSNIALRQVLLESGADKDREEAIKYEQGCILNFLKFSGTDGWIPIVVSRKSDLQNIKPKEIYTTNMHKPCLAQHAAFLVRQSKGDAKWLTDQFYHLQTFVNNYVNHHRDAATGLYYWQNDAAIGVDNDPSTYFRPAKSSGSIYLNCLMYKELKAMVYLCTQLNLTEIAPLYETNAKELYDAIQKNCWDEKDGFFYSVDLNLLPLKDEKGFVLHSGMPRDWDCLIQRLGVWSGFLPLWAGIATPEQAKRVVNENYKDKRTFNAAFGVRTLSKLEKMYNLKASGNPSSWLGPIWGISNYLTWCGLVKYGFKEEARELASKSIVLFGRDVQKTGTMHEYYQPENGEPILNPGFQNWNYLVLNMIAWMENRTVIETF
jgi:putative isomerase